MINAVIYARIGPEEDPLRFNLQSQIESCKAFAMDQNYSIIEIFADKNLEDKLDRPALNSLRGFLLENNIKIVIIYDSNRLFNNLVNLIVFEEALSLDAIQIVYIHNKSSNTHIREEIKNKNRNNREYNKAKIADQFKWGKIRKVNLGNVFVGARPPYGYKRGERNDKATLEIDQEEAKIIKFIFKLYLSGLNDGNFYSQNRIALLLTEMKIPSRGDNVNYITKKLPQYSWQPATIHKILTREAYSGIWYFGKTLLENGKQIPRPKREWLSVKIPAIITVQDYKKAQEILIRNKSYASRNTKNRYLMSRRLRCSKCGYSYVGRTRTINNQYYYCKGKEQKPNKLCDMPQFRVDEINQVIWSWVERILLDANTITQISIYEKNHPNSFTNDQLKEINQFSDQLSSSFDEVDFNTKLRIIEILDVHGRLSIENDEGIIYLTHKLGSEIIPIREILQW
jgi:site-specific DNA recombinase